VRLRILGKTLITPAAITGAMAIAAITGSAAGASPIGNIDVDNGVVTSSKGISNIVVQTCDGSVSKTEFRGEIHTYELSDDVAVVWVKAGNNKSGDGPGYGQRFDFDCPGGYPDDDGY
jgi:hypothetical protein